MMSEYNAGPIPNLEPLNWALVPRKQQLRLGDRFLVREAAEHFDVEDVAASHEITSHRLTPLLIEGVPVSSWWNAPWLSAIEIDDGATLTGRVPVAQGQQIRR